MTDIHKKFTSAVAAGALLLTMALPVLGTESGGISLEITGNGTNSENEVEVEVENEVYVQQGNEAYIENNVSADAKTGGNTAGRNTSGDVMIDTGDAATFVEVDNQANSNVAEVDGCCAMDVDVLISENGADSENEVELEINDGGHHGKNETGTYIGQYNLANVENNIDADAKTGYNKAGRNTGGDVSIYTGSALTGVSANTAVNSNSAFVSGGGYHGHGGSSLSARILGNGADSENEIELEVENEILIMQDNFALVENNVDADAKTGKNRAGRNTGGSVMIDTGDAAADVWIDNMANFNWADVDCGCLMDVWAKIAGNGADSENEIEAELESELAVTQFNSAASGGLFNNVDADAKTGYNKAGKNTGEPEDDPSISTGDSYAGVDIANAANSNVYGAGMGWEWPEMPDMSGYEFGWNFAAMWAMFGWNL